MRPKHPGGRPTLLTPALQGVIVGALQAGSYVEVAVTYAGISKETFYDWLKKGAKEEPGQPHREFSDAVQKAQAHAELVHIQNISTAAKRQWQASAWMLERKFKARWGRGPIEVKDVSEEDDGDLDDLTEEDLHVLLQSIRRKKAELARARLRATPKTH